MATYQDLPFYSGEIVAGKVCKMTNRYAVLTIRGWELPLETGFITWDALAKPAEKLSLGDRLEVMMQSGISYNTLRKLGYPSPKYDKNGFWLNRLPLLENPWPILCERYQEGSVVEVEMINYVNWYIARVRMPEGLIVELRTNDIHPRSLRSNEYGRKLYPGECIRIVFRQIYKPGGCWVERFMGGSTAHQLAEAGVVTPCIATRKLEHQECIFLAKRQTLFP